jgi:hypothetical protein
VWYNDRGGNWTGTPTIMCSVCKAMYAATPGATVAAERENALTHLLLLMDGTEKDRTSGQLAHAFSKHKHAWTPPEQPFTAGIKWQAVVRALRLEDDQMCRVWGSGYGLDEGRRTRVERRKANEE